MCWAYITGYWPIDNCVGRRQIRPIFFLGKGDVSKNTKTFLRQHRPSTLILNAGTPFNIIVGMTVPGCNPSPSVILLMSYSRIINFSIFLIHSVRILHIHWSIQGWAASRNQIPTAISCVFPRCCWKRENINARILLPYVRTRNRNSERVSAEWVPKTSYSYNA